MQRRFRKAALRGVSMAAVLAAIGTFGPAQAAPQPGPAPRSAPRGMLAALHRDLGLTPDRARARLAQEAAAQRAAGTLRRVLGAPPAGMWFDKTAGKLVVAVTGARDARRVRAAGAVARTVPHSRAELTGLARRIGSRAGDGVPGVTGWGVDERANGVVVRTTRTGRTAGTDAFERAARELGARSDIPVRVERGDQAPRQEGGRVVGGERWELGEDGSCSIGFAVTGAAGFRGFLTAGHCTQQPDQPAYGRDGSRLGTSNEGGRHSVNGHDGDFGLVTVDRPEWSLSSDVAGQDGAPVAVTGVQEGVAGTSVCHSGDTSGWHCGEITLTDQTVDYGNVVVDGLSYTNACSAPGDSGGSYVSQSGAPKAVGLHSGGGLATCADGGATITVFQPVARALDRWRLRLKTGAS
ncbi:MULTISPECIES: S1 family peptidase [Streptomyces]|uniref:S1 family peptidase n=1 Tax=Streptomyces kasugaensis TaxID=1946 RepID=A0A4Q9HQL3_STRKA|nr:MULTISPECIES: S1 family peptidase [Streptomyces]MYU55991.1 S1 family peptidase [Streptomyces sp. SID7805]TBO57015.1 S1 family peptidase [Streptomyces kasugaensis]